MREERIKSIAKNLGFSLVGIARAGEADHFERFESWLNAGHAGEMAYLEKNREARRSPASILPDVRSVVMLGTTYGNPPAPLPQSNMGRIARYAQGPDYHRVLWDKLDLLLKQIQAIDSSIQGRGVVDTAPLLERDFARRAGLGWFGKNTMLIDKRLGSYLFLSALLLNIELKPDTPHFASHCGTCTACIDACPTTAIIAPGTLDARRCISYHTIELRGPIPHEFRDKIDNWLFGCDICQEVCPWNRREREGAMPHRDDLESVDACEVMKMSEAEYRMRFRSTAISRAKWNGLRRNAAIVLGNCGNVTALAMLKERADDEDETIKEAMEWAIRRIEERLSKALPST